MLTAVMTLGASVVVGAQSAGPLAHEPAPPPHVSAQSGLPLPSIGLPLPTIGLPLPALGLPFPRIGLPPADSERAAPTGVERDPRAADLTHHDQSPGRRAKLGLGRSVFVVVPAFGRVGPEPVTVARGASGVDGERQPVGHLRLQLQPAVFPRIHVDGYYIGTLDDFGGELALEPGPHELELRAEGYEALELAVMVEAGRTITYRGRLRAMPDPEPVRAQTSSSPDDAVPVSSTIYVVPGCYAGNVPPADIDLPKGCDASRAIAFQPRR